MTCKPDVILVQGSVSLLSVDMFLDVLYIYILERCYCNIKC